MRKSTSIRSRGRPPHRPTPQDRRTVEALAGFGIPAAKAAEVIGIAQSTLFKHYPTELRRGSSLVEAKLVGNLLRLAGGTDGTALKAIIFSLQCRFGWSAYAPRPVELGKKAQADRDAEITPDDWGELVH